MSTPYNATSNQVGAEPSCARISQLLALTNAGGLAIKLWRAEQAVAELHAIYVRKIRQYEGQHGAITGALNPRNHKHIAIIAYTMDEKLALASARRKAYAARRRLRAACAKAAREGAAAA